MTDNTLQGKRFFKIALISMLVGLLGGFLASLTYIFPDFLKEYQGLSRLRPIHVSYVMFWIIIGAVGGIYYGVAKLSGKPPQKNIAKVQMGLVILALVGIFYSYLAGDFGGREYWEFNPIWALPIALAWLLFLVNFVNMARTIKKWPVYVWMWMTGIVFFFLIFMENYLWIFPYFRENFVTDMTIQWKVAGSIVGAINQMTYGVAFFLMDRITGNDSTKVGSSKLAFAVYFLGLFNLMFNWGHHVYPLPTESYVRVIGYAVSMTEWILLIRIFYNWKKDIKEVQAYKHFFPYRFIAASNFWVLINLTIACFMSIPVLNIYVHGTHFIVAHSMGTTIGINTMILLAAAFMIFMPKVDGDHLPPNRNLRISFWLVQISLMVLFMALNIAGLIKGFWLNSEHQEPFSLMMSNLHGYFVTFVIAGTFLLIGLYYIVATLFKYSLKKES
ncbi:MAG TPA: cbb3-type cytochrome c oxidase subunit I [Brumimicrobium sp.]|nr:cbb3-type cytochrome c oxidase subunit I [Brumimicrobium sp.]